MELITTQEKVNILESIFGESSLANSGKNISVICPVCKNNSKSSSKKRKLSICLQKGIYHCWVCESKGKNIASFASRHTNADNFNIQKVKEIFGLSELDLEEKEEIKPLTLPLDFKLLYLDNSIQGNIAKRYLSSRGLTPDDYLKFKIGISWQNEYTNRIIFPSFCDNMKLNYFLSRTYDSSTIRKYKNCDAKRSDIIFNEYLVDWSKPIILVEGVFDSIKAGDNSIPMLGSWIDESHYLFRKIVEKKTPVILGLDPDVKKKTIELAKKFCEYDIQVSITQNEDKDFGDMTKEESKYYIRTAKNYEITDRIEYLIQNIYSGSIF